MNDMTRHRLDEQIKDEIKREEKLRAHHRKFCTWLESNASGP